ncbi:DUF2798 domain-containing protein [Neisseria sp. KEM232]|nr:DUF2798 domain-containing protein [Neisseria sp. KEM232]
MVMIVSGVLVALNTGVDAGYVLRLAKAYLITWPVAFASLLAVRPLVVKLVAASVAE